jgi:uncharacterized membrane protein
LNIAVCGHLAVKIYPTIEENPARQMIKPSAHKIYADLSQKVILEREPKSLFLIYFIVFSEAINIAFIPLLPNQYPTHCNYIRKLR